MTKASKIVSVLAIGIPLCLAIGTAACYLTIGTPYGAPGMGRTVRYAVTTSHGRRGVADIDYRTARGETVRVQGATLPWHVEAFGFAFWTRTHITARNRDGDACVQVEIAVDAVRKRAATACGEHASASASY